MFDHSVVDIRFFIIRMSCDFPCNSPYNPKLVGIELASLDVIKGVVLSSFQFEFEFRRFSWQRSVPTAFEAFYILLEKLHNLRDLMFVITYTSFEGDQLPINNDDNLAFALTTSRSILRLTLQRKGYVLMQYHMPTKFASNYFTYTYTFQKVVSFAAFNFRAFTNSSVLLRVCNV
jgi:PB1 domain